MTRYEHCYLDGAFVPVEGAGCHAVIDPAREEQCAEVRLCGTRQVDEALGSARRGFEVWRRSSLDERKDALARLRDALERRADSASQALAREMGCPVWLGGLMQVPMALQGLEFAAAGLDQVVWQERIGNGLVERVPCGVVAAITPWNFPLHQIAAKVGAALAAGCSVVLKPSEVAPGAALAFMRAVHEAGLPAGTVNLVWGGADVGEHLVAHGGVDHISFTGSSAVGRRIMAAAAARLTPLTLELGGKSAAVVLDDADLAAAIPAMARAGLANSGQVCVSQSRWIVPRRLRDEAIERFRRAAEDWPLGDPLEAATRLGPVATKTQYQHVCRMINGAREQGATCVAGGKARPEGTGYYVPPTLFADVGPEMDIARQEVFGPVIALMCYDSEAEGAELANATCYGLSGAVWSADAQRASSFARRMKTGQVVVNGAAQNLATPFGGWGDSGFGRENGRFGIEGLLNYRSLHGAV